MKQQPKIGDVFKLDFSFTDEQTYSYSKLSGDTNPIHITESYAEKTEFGRCIVHGYFSISIFSKIYGTLLYPQEHILISQTTKYVKPILTGVEYTAVITVKELIPAKNRVCYINEILDKKSGQLKVTGEAILMNKTHYNW